MAEHSSSRDPKVVIAPDALDVLVSTLDAEGYQVIGPQLRDGAIVYEPLASADELPVGWDDRQEGGTYRLLQSDREALFDYVVGPHTWKRYLYPPSQRLWQAQRRGKGFVVKEENGPPPRYAFIGVRSCEIHAMEVQDRVFDNGTFSDPTYLARREQAFVVAVNCARPAATCFCASMDTGPRPRQGFDLALTELIDDGRHEFLVETGNEKGTEVLARLPQHPADVADETAAETLTAEATRAMHRAMVPAVDELLKNNLEHPRWDDVAERCLNCGNCTSVCPTCFCTTVEDVTDLSGQNTERWRRWDSCFTLDFSYIHGGSIRREGRSRYRQWMTHKLSSWHDQFGSSGCVGCGRCITWCPVGIDITAEAQAIQNTSGGT